jgi:hypothetical protein
MPTHAPALIPTSVFDRTATPLPKQSPVESRILSGGFGGAILGRNASGCEAAIRYESTNTLEFNFHPIRVPGTALNGTTGRPDAQVSLPVFGPMEAWVICGGNLADVTACTARVRLTPAARDSVTLRPGRDRIKVLVRVGSMTYFEGCIKIVPQKP